VVRHRPILVDQAAEQRPVLRRHQLLHAAIGILAIALPHPRHQRLERVVVGNEQRTGAIVDRVGRDFALVERTEIHHRAQCQLLHQLVVGHAGKPEGASDPRIESEVAVLMRLL
jgi:hypothetical protein